ncbi:MAG: DUF559 domain-containing protein [Bacteroidetes bacterium]|nr:DUF559 domain-containing protein [Bacteroidota bacterium]
MKTNIKATNMAKKPAQIFHFDLYGKREDKYNFLDENSITSIDWIELKPEAPNFFFVNKNFDGQEEYEKGFKVDELFPINTSGIKTHDDNNLVSFSPFSEKNQKYDYRPFDKRNIFFDLSKVVRPRISVMKHFLEKENLGLITCRQQSAFDFQHVFITKIISDMCSVSSQTKETGYIFPLYLYPDNSSTLLEEEKTERVPNFNMEIVKQIEENLDLQFVPEKFPSSGGVSACGGRGGSFPSFGGVAESRGGSFHSIGDMSQSRSGRNTRNYMSLPYNPELKDRAKALRKAGNLAEVLFWNQVKNKQFKGLDFDRQKIIGNYIVDFYCANCNVVVEIDGSSHDNKQEYDAARDAFLESLGLTIIHIPVTDVMKRMGAVMDMLEQHPVFLPLCTTGQENLPPGVLPPRPLVAGTPPEEGNLPADTVGSTANEGNFTPIDVLDYIYAVLHSPTYREKYKEFLKIDFPRVPYPKLGTFMKLVELGRQLREIHLLESPVVENYITQYPEDGNNVVTKPRFISSPPPEGCPPQADGVVGNVYINETQYFANVPEVAWNFYIGGYQPAQKWLKDRKDRTLEFEDILHYQKIIVAISETNRLMKAIDEIQLI